MIPSISEPHIWLVNISRKIPGSSDDREPLAAITPPVTGGIDTVFRGIKKADANGA